MRAVPVLLACLALLAASPVHASSGRYLSQVATQPQVTQGPAPAQTVAPTSTGPTGTTPALGGGAPTTPTAGAAAAPAEGGAAAPPAATAVAPTTMAAPQGAAAEISAAPPAAERFTAAPSAEEARTVPNWFTLWAVVQQQANLNLGSFNALLQATGLFTQLDDPNAQFTVFAPTDDAFIRTLATLNNVDLQALLASPTTAVPILEGHIVRGRMTSQDFMNGDMLPTLNPNRMLNVIKNETGVFVQPSAGGEPAQIVFSDVLASNGYLDVIDRVLLWPEDMGALGGVPSTEGMAPIASFVGGGFAPVTEAGVAPEGAAAGGAQAGATGAAPTTGTTTTTTGPGAGAAAGGTTTGTAPTTAGPTPP